MGGRVIHRGEHDWQPAASWKSLGLVLALHAAAAWGLLQIESVREAAQDLAPIMVGLITLPPPEPPKPVIETPKPRPKPVERKPEPQMIAAISPEPAAVEAPAPEPLPVEEPPPPPPAPVAEPAPVVPPNFVAAYLDNPAPAFPPVSRRLGEKGKVLLRVVVNPRGLPDSVVVTHSSGYARLDRAAIEAVRKWKFVPAKQGDEAITAAVIVPISFDLISQ